MSVRASTIPLEAVIGGGILAMATTYAWGDFALHGQKLSAAFGQPWAQLVFQGILIFAALASLLLFHRSKPARTSLCLALLGEAAMLLLVSRLEGPHLFDSYPAKLIFIQMLGASALWMTPSNLWFDQATI